MRAQTLRQHRLQLEDPLVERVALLMGMRKGELRPEALNPHRQGLKTLAGKLAAMPTKPIERKAATKIAVDEMRSRLAQREERFVAMREHVLDVLRMWGTLVLDCAEYKKVQARVPQIAAGEAGVRALLDRDRPKVLSPASGVRALTLWLCFTDTGVGSGV